MRRWLLFFADALVIPALGLLLPGALRMLALVPALLLPLCALPLVRPFAHPAWTIVRERTDRESAPAVCIDEALLIGAPRFTAKACIPFASVTADRFRAQPGAMLLSAAAALTASLAAEQLPAQCFVALNLRVENFQRQYPVIGSAELNGAQGVVVRDGTGQRAFYLGTGRVLPALCGRIQCAGHVRDLTDDDRHRLAETDGLHYATAALTDGVPEAPIYLGSLQPERIDTVDADVLDAITELHSAGLPVVWKGSGSFVRSVGLPLDPALPGNLIRVAAIGRERNFALAVRAFLSHEKRRHRFARSMLVAGAAAACIALLTGAYLSASGGVGASAVSAAFAVIAAALCLLPPVWALRGR